MYLEKVEAVTFHENLEPTLLRLTPVYMREAGANFLWGMLFGVFATILSLFAGVETDVVVLSCLPLIALSGFVSSKIFKQERFLPADTRKFYLGNREEMKSILTRVQWFNLALEDQKKGQLLLSPDEQENDEVLARHWEVHGKILQEEADAFVSRFFAAAHSDIALLYQKRKNNPKQLRRAFYEKALQLGRLEESLGNLQEGGYEDTRDLSPFLAAAKLREQLGQEWIVLKKKFPKLKLKPLPKPKAKRLLLAARND